MRKRMRRRIRTRKRTHTHMRRVGIRASGRGQGQAYASEAYFATLQTRCTVRISHKCGCPGPKFRQPSRIAIARLSPPAPKQTPNTARSRQYMPRCRKRKPYPAGAWAMDPSNVGSALRVRLRMRTPLAHGQSGNKPTRIRTHSGGVSRGLPRRAPTLARTLMNKGARKNCPAQVMPSV